VATHSYTGLYYPFIHFKDERWLKLSALYWDKMGRIVPPGYTPTDSKTVVELGKYVETLEPGWVRPNFGKTFIDFVAKRGKALRNRYGVDKVDKWEPVPTAHLPPTAGGPSGSDPRMSYVFYEKLREDLRKVLIDSKIASPDPHDPHWIGMHPRLAQVYMTALADQLAGERGLCPLTDETLDHMAVGGLSVERLAQVLLGDVNLATSEKSDLETESIAAYFSIETVIPANIDEVSVKNIRDFREKYPQERASFQKALAKFAKDREWLKKIDDEDVLQDRLKTEYEKELKPKVDQLRDKLHFLRKPINLQWGAS
jgi:hypothetical protein